MIQDSSIGMTHYGLDGSGLISGRGKRFFCTTQGQSPPSLLSNEYRALCLGVKRTGIEADNSTASSEEVKNDGAIPLRHTCLWCGAQLFMHRDKFNFLPSYTWTDWGRNLRYQASWGTFEQASPITSGLHMLVFPFLTWHGFQPTKF
jgi:hypothetical protein